MALTFTQQPGSLNFANNPIIVSAKTTLTGKTFLRIVCDVLCSAYVYNGIDTTFTTQLSMQVEDAGEATFNLSDAAQTIMRRVATQIDVSSLSTLPTVQLRLIYSCHELYVLDNEEVVGETTEEQVVYVVPGGLTDYELLSRTNIDLDDLANDEPLRMTRKPDPGIVYNGETIILPMLKSRASINGTCYLSVGDSQINGTYSLLGNVTGYSYVTAEGDTDGGLLFHHSSVGPWTGGYFRTNTQGVHFLRFINGFGAVENISVRSKDKLSYEVSGDTHSLVQEATVRPGDRRYATKTQPVGVYELSSGYVPKRWAEWYVQELLTSPRVWIQIGEVWVPALIEAEDECVIYDRTKPEMPHVDFTLRLAVDGVTGVTW